MTGEDQQPSAVDMPHLGDLELSETEPALAHRWSELPPPQVVRARVREDPVVVAAVGEGPGSDEHVPPVAPGVRKHLGIPPGLAGGDVLRQGLVPPRIGGQERAAPDLAHVTRSSDSASPMRWSRTP